MASMKAIISAASKRFGRRSRSQGGVVVTHSWTWSDDGMSSSAPTFDRRRRLSQSTNNDESSSWRTLFQPYCQRSYGGGDDKSGSATMLVDHLLAYTQHLMSKNGEGQQQTTPNHSHSLLSSSPLLLRHPIHHVLAFSGGVDSSLVAALLQQSVHHLDHQYSQQHDQHQHAQSLHTVQAVLGVSPAVPREQVDLARRVARHIQIPLVEVPTTEGTDDMYRANVGQACLACKTHLYTCLQAVAQHATQQQSQQHSNEELNVELKSSSQSTITTNTTAPLVRLYNGTNADDLLDATRVGLLAAARFEVASPLQYIPKSLVRLAARHLGLPNHAMAASPCLRSRLALGVEAIPEHLQRIEQAEREVRHALQLPETASFRVRLLAGQRARVEVEEDYWERASQALLCLQPAPQSHGSSDNGNSNDNSKETSGNLRTILTQQLGFADVTLAIFKSGSVARPVVTSVSLSSSSSSSSSLSSKVIVEHITPADSDSDNENEHVLRVAARR